MQEHNFKFTGSGDEYFKIWIVNILLSIVTLGIYSAWAVVRNRRYFYGNTWLADSNFEYHATPKQILFGRVVALVMLGAYIFLSNSFPIIGFGLMFVITLLMPWLVMRSMQFNTRMSSYRNVRFSFHGKLGPAYKYFLLLPMLPAFCGLLIALAFHLSGVHDSTIYSGLIGLSLLVMFLQYPLMETLLTRYQINHLQYGQGQFTTELQPSAFYTIYLKWIAVGILFGIIIPIGIMVIGGLIIALIAYLIGSLEIDTLSELFTNPQETGLLIMMPLVFLIYLTMIISSIFATAYLTSRKRNYVLSNTRLDDVLVLGSTVKARQLFKLLFGNLVLLSFTMGLATPWIKVRTQKFLLAQTQAHMASDLALYANQQQELQTSLGDQVGDAFDLQGGFEVGL